MDIHNLPLGVNPNLTTQETLNPFVAELDARAQQTPSAAAPEPVELSPSSVPDAMSLSPDALMSYCETRLQSLDSQMTNIFDSQTSNAAMTTSLNNVANVLNNLQAPDSSSPPKITLAPTDVAAVDAAYSQAIEQAPSNSLLASNLNKDKASFDSQCGGGTISADTVSNMTQNLKNDTGTLNSDSEMTMINLQSLMSQRQTAVQLTTNLVQSLGDQASDITKNVGQ